jgi:hypothetical protein
MKLTYQSVYLRIAAVLLALSFGISAHAEPAREEIAHAYRLLKGADHDYDGHRGVAMKELQLAGDKLGLVLEGDGVKEERQWKSDKRLMEARRILREARNKLEDKDRDRAAANVEKAIKELDAALATK